MTSIIQPAVRPRTALLLGNYRPAVSIARALNAAGCRIVLGLEGDEGGCERSKHVAEVWDHPLLEDGEPAFLESLERYLELRNDITIVFPVAEEFVNLFAAARWEPPKDVTLVGPGHDVVSTFADKTEALQLAQGIGVRTLPFDIVSDHETLFRLAARIGYPITVRPLGTTARLGHKKAVIAATPEELIEEIPEWPEGHQVLLLQRCAFGQRHNVYFAARDGKLLAAVESRILRTNHPDGTGLAVLGETLMPSRALLRDTELLTAEHRYTGVGLAQFIVDPETGDRCFLELNPRVSGSHAVPEGAGVPLSAMAVDLAAGEPFNVPGPYIRGKVGLRYAWTSGDLLGVKLAVMHREFGLLEAVGRAFRAVGDALSADIHLLWAWNDPMPALWALTEVLPKFTRARSALSAMWPWRRGDVRPA